MKYYAVTDDPAELMHFGIKGMKWGIRRTDAQLGHPRHTGAKRNRSAAYKKASAKLSSAMRNGIDRAKANWREYNSPENKYYRQTERAIQKARKGKLKYGKLDDYQVQRITERLNMERQARMVSEGEKTWGKRLRESISEGVITGVGQGFGRRASEWIARGSTLKTDRLRAEQQERMNARQAERQFRQQMAFKEIQNRYDNSRGNLKRQAANELRKEYYKTAAEEGSLAFHPLVNRKSTNLEAWKKQKKLEEGNAALQDLYTKTKTTTLAKRAADDVANKLYPNSSKSEKKKEKKAKELGPGASQSSLPQTITNNYYSYGNPGYNVKRTSFANPYHKQPTNRRVKGQYRN